MAKKEKAKPLPLFQECDPLEREIALKDTSEFHNQQDVTREFTEDEIAGMSSEYIRVSIEIDEKKDILAAETKVQKAEIKELTTDSKILRSKIRTGSETKQETVYGFADYKTGIMHFYDKFGEFVSSRPLQPHERQTSIPRLNSKTGTDNEG